MKLYNKGSDFNNKLDSSIRLMTDYVLKTFGPFGKNILINQNGKTFLTKDGVTVAKSITSEDPTENAILDIIKQAADKTVQDAGDGTTTSILLISEFVKAIKAALDAFAHKSSTDILNEFQEQIADVCKKLEFLSRPIESKEMLKNLAFMASNGDEQVSGLVADLIDLVGSDGAVSIRNSKNTETSIKIIEGLKFKSDVASNEFLTDLQEKKSLSDCVVVVSNSKIVWSDSVFHLMKECIENKKSLLFVCPEMDAKVLLMIVANVNRGAIQCAVVYPRYLGNEKLDVFEDIALICGTTINAGTGELSRATMKEWGYCRQVEITKSECTLTDGAAKPEFVDKSIEALRGRLREEEDTGLIKRLDARISRLTSMLGIIFVGGKTEAEIIEKRHRVEDALESCHSALKKGIVPGGGTSLHFIVNENYQPFTEIPKELSLDEQILKQFVKIKLQEICSSIVQRLYGNKRAYITYPKEGNEKYNLKVLNLRTGKNVNAIEEGLIESVWTLQSALWNSFSAAFVLCNTAGSVVEV